MGRVNTKNQDHVAIAVILYVIKYDGRWRHWIHVGFDIGDQMTNILKMWEREWYEETKEYVPLITNEDVDEAY